MIICFFVSLNSFVFANTSNDDISSLRTQKINKINAEFNSLDLNQDNILSPLELKESAKIIFGHLYSDKQINKKINIQINKTDTNCDGLISKEEHFAISINQVKRNKIKCY